MLELGGLVRPVPRRQPAVQERQPQVMLAAGRPADGFEEVVRVKANHAARSLATVEGLGHLGRGPYQTASQVVAMPGFRVGMTSTQTSPT